MIASIEVNRYTLLWFIFIVFELVVYCIFLFNSKYSKVSCEKIKKALMAFGTGYAVVINILTYFIANKIYVVYILLTILYFVFSVSLVVLFGFEKDKRFEELKITYNWVILVTGILCMFLLK